MAHYNLYESIGLDRRWSSDQLAAEISRRLGTGMVGNPGGADELRVALGIVADPSRRARYDAILDDPGHPDLRMEDLRRLAFGEAGGESAPGVGGQSAPGGGWEARHPQGGAGQPRQQWSQQPQQPGATDWSGRDRSSSAGDAATATAAKPRKRRAMSWRSKLLAVAVVLALVCLLVIGLILWIARGGGSDGGKPVKMTEKLVSQETDRDRVDWINENYDEQLIADWRGEKNALDAEDLNEDYTEYVGDGSAVVVADTDITNLTNLLFKVDGESYMEAAETATGVTEIHMVGVGESEDGAPEAMVSFGKKDGEWYLLDIEKAVEGPL
ncbi:hypothetical protein [Corynebacterium frankenforstense]|uniref:hypothetical protein n=1 Tax=Corynebacterium frankenforstense TaxID=1230998 RepID=UPI0009514035|nr:hypothetical protein [Corynebacterium frankenforstense]